MTCRACGATTTLAAAQVDLDAPHASVPIVASSPPPTPSLAKRPPALTSVGIGLVVVGCFAALGLLAIAAFVIMMGGSGSAMAFFGSFFLAVAIGYIPFAGLPLVAGIAILRDKTWSRVLGIVACVVLILAAGSYSMGSPVPDGSGRTPVGWVVGLLAVAGIIVLSLPDVGAWYRSLASARAPSVPRESGGRRVLLSAAAVLGTLAAGALVTSPLSSLRTSADGATLSRDAAFGVALSAIVGGAGIWALWRSTRGEKAWIAWVGSLAAGAGVGVLLGLSAQDLAHSSLLDGKVQDTGLTALFWFMLLAWSVALVVLFATARDPQRAAALWGGATALALAAAGLVLGAYILSDAQALRMAAEARERHSTPWAGTVLLLLSAAALALVRRRR